MTETTFGRIGFIGRFKPLHNGAAAVLEALCNQAEEVLIGIGSANKYNIRNPFTAEETKGMLDVFLKNRFKNYKLIEIPDFAHLPECRGGKCWKEHVKNNFGALDCFVSGNDYVAELLKDSYKIIHPAVFLLKENYIKLRAIEVRVEIARYGDWKKLVPEEVANYLEERGLIDRFRQEFGLGMLAELVQGLNYNDKEDAAAEALHTQEI